MESSELLLIIITPKWHTSVDYSIMWETKEAVDYLSPKHIFGRYLALF